MNFVDELKWRKMVQDMVPGTKELMNQGPITGYVGFDPTADSLHVGNMVPIMMLVHFQRCGNQPIALVGGATGLVGDPSGKSDERKLMDKEELNHNLACIHSQLAHFLDFNDSKTGAKIVNNYDWFEEMKFLDFIRDIGKHISINYMMAKDSVQSRLETGLSFTEFTYQLVQGYDFYWLYKNMNCQLQMGGSDQWGNITTGTEMVRRIGEGKAFGLTTPLLTKSDGGKFGKTEQGNVWLDPKRTSPYQFYQFWRKSSDTDAEKYIRIFSIKSQEEVEGLIAQHTQNPGENLLQETIAEEITSILHGKEVIAYIKKASQILYGKSTSDDLKGLEPEQIEEIFAGVSSGFIVESALNEGVGVLDFLVDSGAFSSKGEARRMIQQGGLKINKEKWDDPNKSVSYDETLKGKYILVSKGKKSNHLVMVK